MGLPPVEDLLRRHWADAGQRVELLERGRVEMDGAGGTGRCGARLARTRCHRRRAPWHDDLKPVLHRSGEVDRLEIGLARRPARASHGIRDPRPVAEGVQPGPPNSADDVDDDLPVRGRRGVRGEDRMCLPSRRSRRSPAAREMARGEDDDHQTNGEGGQQAAAERGFHVAYSGNKPGTASGRKCVDCVTNGR